MQVGKYRSRGVQGVSQAQSRGGWGRRGRGEGGAGLRLPAVALWF